MRKKANPLVKPFLKWAGGKRQLLPQIKEHFPEKFNNYIEPFVGAGAVFFDLQVKNATINDYNEQLINTYTVIKNNLEDLIVELKKHEQMNSEEYYYSMRDLDRNVLAFLNYSNVLKAARLIYLNKTCYNGLYRVNSQGLFNVPYGKYKNPLICDISTLKAINHYLNDNNIEIMHGDFENALMNADKNTFVYLDPPYHSEDNNNFTGYQAGGFSENEQVRLKEIFDRLSKKGVKCLLSNSDTSFIRELYKDYNIYTIYAKRSINSNSQGRGEVKEVLVKNW